MFFTVNDDLKRIDELQINGEFNVALNELAIFETREDISQEVRILSQILKGTILQKMGLFNQALKVINQAIKLSSDNLEILLYSIYEKAEMLWELKMIDDTHDLIEDAEKGFQKIKQKSTDILLYHNARINDLKSYYFILIRDFEQAIHYSETGLKLKRKMNDKLEIIRSLIICGWANHINFNLEEAITYTEEALALATKIKCINSIFHSRLLLGLSNWQNHNYDVARDYFDKCMETAKKVENNYYLYLATYAQGYGLFSKDAKASFNLLEKALKLLNKIENYSEEISLNASIAVNNFSLGKNNEALPYIRKALEIYHKAHKNKPTTIYAYLLRTQGQVFLNLGKLNEALDYCLKAIEVCRAIDDREGLSASLFYTGATFRRLGDIKSAIDCYTEGLTIAEEIKYDRMATWILNSLSYAYLEKGEIQKGIDLYLKAVKRFEHFDENKDRISNFNYYLGNFYYEKGEIEKAYQYTKLSYEQKKSVVFNLTIVRSLFLLIRICLELNQIEQAELYLKHLEDSNKKMDNRIVDHSYRTAKAMLLKTSMRSINRAEAEKILVSVINEEVAISNVTIIALINLCELLLEEFRITGELEVLTQLQTHTQKLVEIAQNQESPSLTLEAQHLRIITLWLQAQHSIKKVDLKEIQELLVNTQELAEMKGLLRIASKIFNKHNKLLEQLDVWDEFLRNYYDLIQK
ncbi:MAG: tetratricopeptide repeat protein [Asgard group archaeon]|nr:tetratricopeptide repeat protein [Asgard group archaeon]